MRCGFCLEEMLLQRLCLCGKSYAEKLDDPKHLLAYGYFFYNQFSAAERIADFYFIHSIYDHSDIFTWLRIDMYILKPELQGEYFT